MGRALSYSAVKKCDCWHAVQIVKKRKVAMVGTDRKSMAAGE
jgi:hypothetical protein